MNTKTLIAAVIGGVSAFLLGWLFYGIIFKEMLAGMGGSAQGVMKAESEFIWWSLILGNLIIGYLIAWVFSTWAGITTFAGGAKAGAMMGLLFTLGFDMITYAVTNLWSLSGTFLDILISTIIWAISAGLVGWWLGRK